MPIIRAAKSVSYLEYSADSEPWFQLMLVLRRKHSHTRIVQQGLKISRNFTEKCLFIAGNCTFYILNDSFAEIVWFSLHTIMFSPILKSLWVWNWWSVTQHVCLIIQNNVSSDRLQKYFRDKSFRANLGWSIWDMKVLIKLCMLLMSPDWKH